MQNGSGWRAWNTNSLPARECLKIAGMNFKTHSMQKGEKKQKKGKVHMFFINICYTVNKAEKNVTGKVLNSYRITLNHMEVPE